MLNYVFAFKVTTFFPRAATSTNSPLKYLKSELCLNVFKNLIRISQKYLGLTYGVQSITSLIEYVLKVSFRSLISMVEFNRTMHFVS